MAICKTIPGVCLVVASCWWVQVASAAEGDGEPSEPASFGWRPVIDDLIEQVDQLDQLDQLEEAGTVEVVSAAIEYSSWRSLVDEAGRVARRWTKRVEIGARVLRGNTDEDFVRVAGVILREQDQSLHRIDWGGRFGQVNGLRNTNRWYLNSTIDRSQPAGWLYYISSRHEYNEFQGIDYRGTGSVGVGFKFVDEEDRHVLMRLGPALTLEVYSDSGGDRLTEEFSAEIEIDWPLFERTRLESKTTMRPNVVALDVFRFRTETAVMIPLDEDARWSLKLGYLLDYNSSLNSVEGRMPMDLTTSVSIVYLRP